MPTCREQVVFTLLVSSCQQKSLEQGGKQLVTILLILSDLLQGCSMQQARYSSDITILETLRFRTATRRQRLPIQ